MATPFDNSFGTLLSVNISGTMTVVPGVKDFDPPPSMFELHDITSHSSDDGREEVAPGLKRNPEFTIPLTYKGSNEVHQYLETAHDDQTLEEFQVEFIGSGRVWSFSGYIPNFTVHAPVNGVYTADMTLKPTGAIDRDAA